MNVSSILVGIIAIPIATLGIAALQGEGEGESVRECLRTSGSSPFGPRPKVPYYKSRKTGEDGWTRHNVPIICGTRDGQCGITECECVCHK